MEVAPSITETRHPTRGCLFIEIRRLYHSSAVWPAHVGQYLKGITPPVESKDSKDDVSMLKYDDVTGRLLA